MCINSYEKSDCETWTLIRIQINVSYHAWCQRNIRFHKMYVKTQNKSFQIFQVISSWQETGERIWNVLRRRSGSKTEETEMSFKLSFQWINILGDILLLLTFLILLHDDHYKYVDKHEFFIRAIWLACPPWITSWPVCLSIIHVFWCIFWSCNLVGMFLPVMGHKLLSRNLDLITNMHIAHGNHFPWHIFSVQLPEIFLFIVAYCYFYLIVDKWMLTL